MIRKRTRAALGRKFFVEALDARVVPTSLGVGGVAHLGLAEVAGHSAKPSATKTAVVAQAGTLGQPITYVADVSVGAKSKAGAPTGTVKFLQDGQVIGSSPLMPTAVPLVMTPGGSTPRATTSEASLTLTAQAGGEATYFGKHAVTAVFVPGGSFLKSHASKAFTVAQPDYQSIGNGVEVATIATGSGATIASGQTANVLYSGYLASNGQLFDDSTKDGGSPLAFQVGAGEVVPGFDSGTLGMKVGETRIIAIPPSQGYGSTANGPIPANSTLLFVVTLQSIS